MKCALYLLAALLLSVMAACNHTQNTEFAVDCIFDGIVTDSVTLQVVEEDYGMKRVVATSTVKTGKAHLQGQLDAPVIALLTINRVDRPFYFILESGATQLHFTRSHTLALGGEQNHVYARYEHTLSQINDKRTANRKQYLKHVADSSLTKIMERRFVKTDSLLCDSVQRMTVRMINAGGPVGRLIREQHYGVLDSLYRTKILIKKNY